MPRYEFQCDRCAALEDVHVPMSDPVPADGVARCVLSTECDGVMRRVWGVPAIGAGSSGGTPARGHQRFVKGDAGWTNG